MFASGCSSKSTPCDPLYGGSAAEFMGSLVDPAPNATAIPDSTQTLIFADVGARSIFLMASGGVAVQTTPTALPDPLPSPLTGEPTTVLTAVSAPALQAGTTYATGVYSDLNACAGDETFRAIGTFTTQ